MKVRDIMLTPAVKVGPESPVDEVARALLDGELPAVPVVGQDGRVLGVVTERDLVHKHASLHLPRYLGFLGSVIPLKARRTEDDFRHMLAVTARQLMSDEYDYITVDAEVDDAAAQMVDRETAFLLVVEQERLVGLVTSRDIIRLLLIEDDDGQVGAT